MLREKVAKLAKLMFAGATMALCVATINPSIQQVQADAFEEQEPNDTPGTATTLPLNTWICGVSAKGSDSDYYSFIIPEGNGSAQVELKTGEDNPKNAYWTVYLQDEERHNLHSFSTRSEKGYVLGLAPGKYYVKVKCVSGYGPQCSYNLKVNYTASDAWEKEQYYGNKTMGNANPVSVNKLYTGNLYSNSDKDYYRIKLKGTNDVTFRFMVDDSVDVPGKWRVEFYDGSKKLLKADKSSTASSNQTWKVRCTGDLIVKIGNFSNARGKIYHIKASAKAYKAPVTKPATTVISSIKSGKNQATVYWRKANNATGYYVYRSTSANSGYKKIATVTGKTSYTDKKSLKSKKTYYYKVVSIRKSGSKVLTAKSSVAKKVKIK